MSVVKKFSNFYRRMKMLVPSGHVYRDMSQHRGPVRDPEVPLELRLAMENELRKGVKKRRWFSLRNLSERAEVELMGQTMQPRKRSVDPTPEPDSPKHRYDHD
jgi:hypothetical protein